MSEPLWRLDGVTLGDRPPRLSIDTLEIPPGRTAILGTSGAGKSSLLNLLVRFERPSRGHLEFLPPVESSPRSFLPLFWMPAEGAFWPHLNVWQHLEAVSPRSVDRVELEEALRQFDLGDCRDSFPEHLSSGQRSRLGLLISIVAQPRVLVLDEPLAHLDQGRARDCWQYILNSLQARRAHLVFATHAPELVHSSAEHVVCLEAGRVQWCGSVDELYTSPPSRHVAEFLGPVNWFEPAEREHWLCSPGTEPICLRPEHIAVTPDRGGPFRVMSAMFLGSREEVTLEDARQNTRIVVHRPASSNLQPGMLANLRTLLALLLLFLPLCFPGCERAGGAAPLLRLTPIRHRPLPPEGIMLPAPRGLTYGPENELYILDNAGRVLVFNEAGEELRRWWMPEYSVGKPERACILRDGRIAIADTHYHRVVFFDTQGTLLSTLGEFGRGPGQFIYTVAVAQDDSGNLYVAEYGGHDRVQKFTSDGEYLLEFGDIGTAPTEFQRPSGIFWRAGLLYIADAINNRIQVFNEQGEFQQVLADAHSAGLHYPYDLALAPDDTIYIVEYGAGRVTRLSLSGELLGRFGHEGRRLGEFWTPWGIAVSSQGRVAVADTGNRRLVELEP